MLPKRDLVARMNKWLSKENTTSVNGLFLLIVFFSHIQSYVILPHEINMVTKGLGQLMVAMFLFHSGYGVMESVRKKGMAYVKTIPVNRIFKVWVFFAVSVCLFAVVNLCMGNPFTLSDFFLSLIGWENLGNSNWYIFVILCLYLLTWISFSVAGSWFAEEGKRNVCGFIILLLLTGVLFAVLHETKQPWWYNTLSAYPFGILVSFGKEKIEKWLERSIHWWAAAVISLVMTILLRQFSSHSSVYLVMTLFFCTFVITFTKKAPMYHMALEWVGVHLFECYILMRIPMMVLRKSPLSEHTGVYTLVCFVLMIVFAACYQRVLDRLSRIVNFSSSRSGR